MEHFPEQAKVNRKESLERKPKSALRQYVITGLGAAAVFTSALYKDKDGNDAFDKFLDIATADAVEKAKTNLSPQELERFNALALVVEKKLGGAVFAGISDLDDDLQSQAESRENSRPDVSGFENTGLINNEAVTELLGPQFFPQGWVEGRIGSVTYDKNMSDETVAGLKATAKNNGLRGVAPDTIMFAELSPEQYAINENLEQLKPKALGTVLKILRHEVCHSNDWRDRSSNTFMERLELLASVIERTESEDHYTDEIHVSEKGKVVSYHELSGTDTRSDRSTTYEEYFADICAAYLTDPKAFAVSNPKDFALIDVWVSKKDLDFKNRVITGGPFDPQSGQVTEWAKQLLR